LLRYTVDIARDDAMKLTDKLLRVAGVHAPYAQRSAGPPALYGAGPVVNANESISVPTESHAAKVGTEVE
jgi:hypothetical protein